MKQMKKLASAVLALIMVLAMAIPAAAAPAATDGTITIDNPKRGHTYTIYQILELESYNTTTGTYSYRIANSSWENFITNYPEGETTKVFKVDPVQKYVTIENELEDVVAFAKAALAYAKKTSGISAAGTATFAKDDETADEEKKIVFENLPLGYYLLDSNLGTLCGLDTTNKDVTIHEKNDAPEIDKKVQENSKIGEADEWGKFADANRGDTVNFKVTIKPKKGAENYTMHDIMQSGMTFKEDSLVVTLKHSGESKTLVANTDYVLKTGEDVVGDHGTPKCTFEVVFKQELCDTLETGDEIVVTYSAIVKQEAYFEENSENSAKLTYGDKNFTTEESKVKVRTWQIPIYKYGKDEDSSQISLPGATFSLYRNTEGDPIEFVHVDNTDTDLGALYRVAMETDASTYKRMTEITTGESGRFVLRGLDAGDYYLKEIEAPDGYNKMSGFVKITIDHEGKVILSGTTGNTSNVGTDGAVEIENKTGSLLPETGGIGTTIFYVVGGILVVGAAVLLVTRKRMSAEK